MQDGYELVPVSSDEDWAQYHAIRRVELFEKKGRMGMYDPTFPDEYAPGHTSLLLKRHGEGIGTVRFDLRNEGEGIIRLVAIAGSEQGKGHGKVLGSLIEDYARAHDVRTIYVNSNPEAVGYYEKLGYIPDSWDKSELTGISADAVQMSKKI